MTAIWRERIALGRDLFWLGGIIAAISLFILSVFAAGIMALWGSTTRTYVQDWLGISAIYGELAEVTGRSRVIREEAGMAYVREPVYLGEAITLVLFIGRTEVGAACRLVQLVPVYTDDHGVTLSGEPREPVRQIGRDTTRLEIDMQPPARLGAGHAVVQLQLEYLCGEIAVFEMTEPVDFTMLPAP